MSCYLAEPDPFPAPRLRFCAAVRTDRGTERDGNEDAATLFDLGAGRAVAAGGGPSLIAPAGLVAVVCDGMGGEAGGEIASQLAVESIVAHLASARAAALDVGARARVLVEAVHAADARVKREARERPRYARMGTTATLASIAADTVVCAQIGDSRAYVLRDRDLVQLTTDQTVAQMLRASGAVPDGAIGEIVGSHVILQAVGSSARLDVAVTYAPLAAGDVVLLCSDGLSGVVPDDELREILSTRADPASTADALVARALRHGAPDNVTCVVCSCDESSERTPLTADR